MATTTQLGSVIAFFGTDKFRSVRAGVIFAHYV